jgi:hypothetical protein
MNTWSVMRKFPSFVAGVIAGGAIVRAATAFLERGAQFEINDLRYNLGEAQARALEWQRVAQLFDADRTKAISEVPSFAAWVNEQQLDQFALMRRVLDPYPTLKEA